ncbi:tetratricopeptide repeat protein [Muricauda sp. MAR_2010_75]|uniref:tetratricopeptide repeat protein n=1 Tax=Allomuricauda sp. MAR_2010_75 TaxID=1250232 RepID=UPI000A99AF5A|nr:tetratricopeptide repeat protein [Muricauda sp. MAR_2010_75]
MKKLALLGFMGLFCWVAHAQLRSEVDSLTRILEKIRNQDTTTVGLLLDIANTYRGINLDTSHLYAKKAFDVASSIGYTYGMASADKIKGTYFLYSGAMDSSVFYYQKGQELFQELGDLDGIHDINYNLGLLHASIAEYDKAISFYKKDFTYRNKIGDTLGIADGYLNMGAVYLYKGDNQNAYKNFTASIPYFEAAGDHLSVAKVNFNLGTIQWNYSNYDLALNDFFASLTVFEEEGDHYLLASCLENIAGVYENLGNYENALEYYRASLHHGEEVGDARLTASNYHSLGVVMDKHAQQDSALYYFDKSLKLSQEGNFKDLISQNYHSLGVWHAKGDPSKGISFLNKSIALKRSITSDNYNIATSLYELGTVYLDQGQFSKARESLEEGWQVASLTDSKEMKSRLSHALYGLYKKMRDQTRTLTYLEQYQAFKDSIFDDETNKNIVAREIQYETAKKDRQIELLTTERELKQAEMATQEAMIKQKTTQRNLLLGGIASMLIISLLLFRNYQVKLRTKEVVNKKQREFVELRSRFFANVSHEFRTPLTLILGPLKDLLASKKEDAGHQQSYELMKRNGEKLLGLVNQLLDLAKLEAGALPLQIAEGDLKTSLKTITAAFSSWADYRNVIFNINIAKEIETGWYDGDALEKIINNLLSNAFKFTPEGGEIHFNASLVNTNKNEEGQSLKIEVEDTGKGIASSELDKVFDRFHQVEGTQQGTGTGTGIGLALVKELVELHHGNVSVVSEMAKGTIFTVILPIAKEQFGSSEIALQGLQKPDTKKSAPSVPAKVMKLIDTTQALNKDLPLILIVEDNDDVRFYIKQHLGKAYHIKDAISGNEGFKVAQKTIPDLIISDVMMPGMDGLSLCKKLKTDERTSHIPVILLTALASQASKVEGIETGADDYIIKPFDRKELVARVKNRIDQRRLLREKYSRQLTLEPKLLAVTSTDEHFLERILRIVEQHLDDSTFGVGDLARETGMSRTQLFRKMRALIDQSPQDFIRDFRLKRAAQLLKGRAGNVSEIAYQVGFNNLSYFTKRFKELFGNTPSEYYQGKSKDGTP